MPSYNYLDVGQAFVAAQQWAALNVCTGHSTGTGISVNWTPASGSTPGYFTVATGGGSFGDATFTAQNSILHPNVSLQQLVRNWGFNCTVQYNDPTDGTGPNGWSTAMQAFWDNGEACIQDMTGAARVNVYQGYMSAGTGGANNRYYIMSTEATVNEMDIFLMIGHNLNQDSLTYPQQSPVAPVYWPGGGGQGNAVVQVNTSAPLDMDLALNQGQAIFSMVSRQTTMLP
jgi:hypothetical protein